MPQLNRPDQMIFHLVKTSECICKVFCLAFPIYLNLTLIKYRCTECKFGEPETIFVYFRPAIAVLDWNWLANCVIPSVFDSYDFQGILQ